MIIFVIPFRCGGGETCLSPLECSGDHVRCKCSPDMKIPELDVSFVRDQREKVGHSGGNMAMASNIDMKDKMEVEKEILLTERRNQREDRVIEEKEVYVRNVRARMDTEKEKVRESNKEASDDSSYTLEEECYEDDAGKPKTSQTRLEMKHFSAELRRYFVSDRAGSALWNAAVKDLELAGLISCDEETRKSLIVDRYKCRREKEKFGMTVLNEKNEKIENEGGFVCLGVDGKRDRNTKIEETTTINGIESITRRTGVEEHQVYTSEPNGEYLSHSALKSGTGESLAQDFVEVLADTQSKDSLRAVLCDGCKANTGWKSGMFVNIERKINSQLLCCSCMLHANELYLREVFIKCDGNFGTTGPESFGGPLGKMCQGDVHQKDVANFQPIKTEVESIPDEVSHDLSRDQQLLYSYCQAIHEGKLCQSLSKQAIGPLNHARWLTLAVRILALYTRTEEPSTELKQITRLITQVYAPMWFRIRRSNNFINGPKLIFETMKLLETQDLQIQELARPTIQRNAFFAEPGMMACAMLASEESNIRSNIVSFLLENRKKEPVKPKSKVLKGIRKFQVPLLNWTADHWCEIITWDFSYFYEPKIISDISDEALVEIRICPYSFPAIPLHSTSVERAIKMVSEASSQVYGLEARHKLILSMVEARKMRKPYDTKKDYVDQAI